MRKTFKTWYEPLRTFIQSKEFVNIALNIRKDRNTHTIIPKEGSDLFFKVFRETNYDSLKVVILGLDPYHTDNGAYDGLAFSNSTLAKPQPSLQNILTEVESDVYNGLNLERMSNYSLYNWAEQNVLLINTAMSVRTGQPDSHTALWRPFTLAVIKAICERNDIVWLLWGKKAEAYKQFIKNSSHSVIINGHPSPLNTYNPFLGCKCFSRCNTELEARNKSKIIW